MRLSSDEPTEEVGAASRRTSSNQEDFTLMASFADSGNLSLIAHDLWWLGPLLWGAKVLRILGWVVKIRATPPQNAV